MDIGKLVSWLIAGAIAYGGYNYLSTGDVTFIAPSQQTVLKLATEANRNLPRGSHLATGKSCVRTGGGKFKRGIYSCEIKVFTGMSSYEDSKNSYNILVTKRNGQWQITR
ncbi:MULTISPECIES: hypothetical protein [Eikenella]|uniref:DUF4878 domain-containing protein n=1 Tax=Eikenella longinqua TaxID=1795827 RepID=A0A1A9RVK9_9NEIS|nr:MULTISPECIES: hypothetical protein [Eikenella]OAM26764.1 hypothetical protein A7P95_08385 [Eikenella longinqua]